MAVKAMCAPKRYGTHLHAVAAPLAQPQRLVHNALHTWGRPEVLLVGASGVSGTIEKAC